MARRRDGKSLRFVRTIRFELVSWGVTISLLIKSDYALLRDPGGNSNDSRLTENNANHELIHDAK
jgi:hypothetical protein